MQADSGAKNPPEVASVDECKVYGKLLYKHRCREQTAILTNRKHHVATLRIIAVCIYRYVITFGLRSKYDVLGHYFIFMIVLPSINKFNMTSHQFNMT